jgi:hypothetical protein
MKKLAPGAPRGDTLQSDRVIPRDSAVTVRASIIIERPSGELTESPQILMTQIGEGVSLFAIGADNKNLRMKRSSRLWR